MQKTIGIIGGMGPAATCDLFNKIITITDAKSDQEHPHVLIDSNTAIPDRTKAILQNGEDPLPEMIRSAQRLQGMGADILIMPCNTAHYFYDALQPFLEVPLLHMPNLTAQYLQHQGVSRVGLLATDGTIKSSVYGRALEAVDIEVILPSTGGQSAVMDIIYNGVKASNYTINLNAFQKVMEDLLEKGAETLILGCTELPVAFTMYHFQEPAVDPTLILARAAVAFVGKPLKE